MLGIVCWPSPPRPRRSTSSPGQSDRRQSVAIRREIALTTYVGSGSRDRCLRLYDLRSKGQPLVAQRELAHEGAVTGVSFTASAQHPWLVSGGEDGVVRVWDLLQLGGMPLLELAAHGGPITCLACSPCGTLVASGGTDRLVKLHNFSTGENLASYIGHRDTVSGLTFSPGEGYRLVSVSQDRTARVVRRC